MRLGSFLPAFSLRRPVTTAMVLVATLVLGAIAYQGIPVQLMPRGFDYPFLWVWMPYTNASPQEVEQTIVRPVEDVLETLPGIATVRARAGRDFANFRLEFDQSTDMEGAYNGLVDRLERIRPELPDDLERWFIYKYDPDDEPILWAAVAVPDTAKDPAYTIETKVVNRLERIPGVARVEFNGAHRARLYIDFDREAVERHSVNLGKVMQDLLADNFTLPSGRVEEDGRVVLVRSIATFESRDEIARVPVRDGVVLEDIANVILARPTSTSIHRVNGLEAASLEIYKESGANTIDVAERLRDELDELGGRPGLEGFKFLRFFDQGELIQDSVNNLKDTALQGGFLAVLVLFLFLRKARVTLLIAMSIPLSLLITVVVMYFRGDTINLLSMMGLMLSVGMVVDNSIVVVESIYRRRELGDDARTAAVRGTAEVALAILAATSTTVVVFLPLILMSDDAGFAFYMGKLGLPVCFALGASLIVALVFVPLGTVFVAPGGPATPSRVVQWATEKYASTLAWVLRRRVDAVLLAALAMISVVYPAANLKESDQISGGITDFVVGLRFPASFSTSEIDGALTAVEGVLLERQEEWRIRAVRTKRWAGSRRGFVMAFLEKRERGDIEKEEMTKLLPDLIPDQPGVESWMGWRKGEGGGNSIELRLNGDDSATLVAIAEEIAGRLRDAPGVLGVSSDAGDEGATDELQVIVDRNRAVRYGVSPRTLAQTVSFGFRGTGMRPVLLDGKEFMVQAGFQADDRRDAHKLENFGIWSPTVGQVALGTVADLEYAKGLSVIHRRDRKTSIDLNIDLEIEDLSAARDNINAALAAVELPRGYTYGFGDRFKELEEQDRARGVALKMSLIFVFLLMGMLFESAWLPLSVLLTVPFAFLGVFWLLFFTGTTFEMMAGIGLVILIGIVVNNAIVLVDRVQQNRIAGMERTAAILDAGRERFRPIVMTAATTIVGLLPMAVGKAGLIGIPYYPLGRAVIGGLLASTVLSLVLVPLVYSILDDLRSMLITRVWKVKPAIVALAAVLPMIAAAPEARADLREDIEAIENFAALGADATSLELKDAIHRGLRENLGLRVKVHELEAAAERRTAALGPWMPFMTAGFNYTNRLQEEFQSLGEGTWRRQSERTPLYTLGVGARLLTGTTLDFNWSQGSFAQDVSYDPPLPFFEEEIKVETRFANLSFSINQSLLQGIDPRYHLHSIFQAEIAEESAEVERDREMERVVSEVMKGYWDLVAALRNVEIARIDRRLAEAQRATTNARIAAGDDAPIEVYRIDEEVAARSSDVLEAERTAAEAQQTLAILLGGAPGAGPLRPVSGVELNLPYRARDNSIAVARDGNPDLRLQRRAVRSKGLDQARARHELLPDLSLDASVNLRGNDDEAQAAVTELFEARFPDVRVGMNFTMPLPDVGAVHGMRAAARDLEAAELGMQVAERQVVAGVETALRSIASFDKQIDVAEVRATYAAKTAEAAEATYAAGRNTLQDVLEAQARLKDARRAVVAARVQALKARVDLEVLRGSLLEVLGIEID
jgi:HAE1 family hydrophobic/amphiphilic exporter-1